MKKSFKVPSLLAAGFVIPSGNAVAAVPDTGPSVDDTKGHVISNWVREHQYHLAGHRSHSSHRSHGSHRSHRSSSGGSSGSSSFPSLGSGSSSSSSGSTYTPPASGNSTSPESLLPKAPTKTLPGNSLQFRKVVMRVQAALFARGYYHDTIDGLVGPKTRMAVSKFQSDNSLPVTGTLTQELLDALQVSAN